MVIVVLIMLIAATATTVFVFTGDEEADDVEEVVEIAENVSEENVSVVNETNITTEDDFSETAELHWDHMPLTYKVRNKNNCDGSPLEKIEEALEILEESSVSFVEEEGDVDIEIRCVDGGQLLKDLNGSIKCDKFEYDFDKVHIDPIREGLVKAEDYFINYTRNFTTRFVNNSENVSVLTELTTLIVCYVDAESAGAEMEFLKEQDVVLEGSIIKSHKINIYKSAEGWNSCSGFPAKELHDLLHGFGFAHSQDGNFDPNYGWPANELILFRDIMFPTIECKYQKNLQAKYVNCLNKIYGEEGDCSGVNFIT